MWTCSSHVPSGRCVADEDGVVEVPGGFAVDGDDGEVAEVAAAGDFLRIEAGDGARAASSQNIVRENVREVVLADDDLDIHAKVAFAAEDFDDAAAGGTGGGGPVGDLDVDDHAFQVRGVTERILRADILTNDAMRGSARPARGRAPTQRG